MFGRIEVKRLASQLVSLVFQSQDLRTQFVALLVQLGFVDEHTCALHLPQHMFYGQLHLFIQFALFGIQLRQQHRIQAPSDVGIFSGVMRCIVQSHIGKRNLLRAFATQAFIRNGGDAQMALGQFVHAVAQMAFQHIRQQHGIGHHALQLDGVIGKNVLVVFDVLADFAQFGVFQIRLEGA